MEEKLDEIIRLLTEINNKLIGVSVPSKKKTDSVKERQEEWAKIRQTKYVIKNTLGLKAIPQSGQVIQYLSSGDLSTFDKNKRA